MKKDSWSNAVAKHEVMMFIVFPLIVLLFGSYVWMKEDLAGQKPKALEYETTLQVGQMFELGKKQYTFSGFINDDRFVFERVSEIPRTTYHSASVGYEFVLPNAGFSSQVKAFDKKKGTITLTVKKNTD